MWTVTRLWAQSTEVFPHAFGVLRDSFSTILGAGTRSFSTAFRAAQSSYSTLLWATTKSFFRCYLGQYLGYNRELFLKYSSSKGELFHSYSGCSKHIKHTIASLWTNSAGCGKICRQLCGQTRLVAEKNAKTLWTNPSGCGKMRGQLCGQTRLVGEICAENFVDKPGWLRKNVRTSNSGMLASGSAVPGQGVCQAGWLHNSHTNKQTRLPRPVLGSCRKFAWLSPVPILKMRSSRCTS